MLAALWVVITYAIGGIIRSKLSGIPAKAYEVVDRFNCYLVGAVSGVIFGLQKHTTVTTDEMTEEVWNGRLSYLEKRVERIVGDATRTITNNINGKIAALEEVSHDSNGPKVVGFF